MTEAEWLASCDSIAVLKRIGSRTTDRKLRHFLIACCQQVWDQFKDVRAREAVTAGGLLADGLLSEANRLKADEALWDAREDVLGDVECAPDLEAAVFLTSRVALNNEDTNWRARYLAYLAMDGEYAFDGLMDEIHAEQCNLLRDIFGNPFRPVTFAPAWLTPTVVALTNGIYTDRAFDRMPMLADALEEAGCDNAEVLLHCRGDGPHVRGCWVVDAVLGKV